MLNHFVFEESDKLVNITTKKYLPKDSTKEELHKNYFLEGQEQDSIDYFLFGKEKTNFSIDLIPTWECNLRCGHCFVLHELLKKDTREINKDLLVSFIKKLLETYPSVTNGTIQFIGGEPTLRSEKNLELIRSLKDIPNLKIKFSATSNGSFCDKTSIEFFSVLDSLVISLDGPEAINNLQRKSITGDKNPFWTTIETIKKLVSAGMRDKLIVQASLNEEHMTKENLVEFYKILLMCGVKFEKIIPGFVCPTSHNPKLDREFVEVHKKNVRNKPCCKYRHMVNFVVDNSNNVFCDYFDATSKNLLGSLSDPISKIAENHEKIIRESFSVLNDPKCKKCPVIGLCWGWCTNTKGLNPSEHCDQDLLIEKAKKNAEEDNLINLMKNSRRHDITKLDSL
jgi:radical SAM protein with 4Fe4S-binding SPASM domain